MSKIRVEVTSKDVKNEDGLEYTGYGIIAYRTEPPEIVFEIEDLSSEKDEVISIAKLISDNDVSAGHFGDIIEDFCV
ncbi:MAG: hypothetical protein GX107_08185 [Clostridiales bacterium]|nr:hypothetical protein [Clostridiales bacterium]